MDVYRTTVLTQVLMQFVIRMIVFTEQHASECKWDDVRRFPIDGRRYGEQKIAQFRTHYLMKESAYVSTQQSGYFPIDTEMI
jgi:hypothetical protein